MKHFDHPKSDSTAWVGAIGGLVLLLSILALQVLYYRMEATEVYLKQGGAAVEAMEMMRSEQESRLADTRWLDRDAGRAAIPIEDAMKRIVQTQGGDAQ